MNVSELSVFKTVIFCGRVSLSWVFLMPALLLFGHTLLMGRLTSSFCVTLGFTNEQTCSPVSPGRTTRARRRISYYLVCSVRPWAAMWAKSSKFITMAFTNIVQVFLENELYWTRAALHLLLTVGEPAGLSLLLADIVGGSFLASWASCCLFIRCYRCSCWLE